MRRVGLEGWKVGKERGGKGVEEGEKVEPREGERVG